MHLSRTEVHLAWDRSLPAAAEVAPGSTVTLELRDAANGQLDPGSTSEALRHLDPGQVNPVTGPLRVPGAEAGDTIVVHVLDLDVAEWGWAGLIPGFGLLAVDFPDPLLVHARTSQGRVALDFGVDLHAEPMVGTLGVALPEPGRHPLLPPSRHGGNLDIRQLVPGATLRLPVGVPGALLSVGDAHATMGDGEVCGTGVETEATVRLAIDLEKGTAPRFPVLEVPGRVRRTGDALVTTGVGPDLYAAAQDATRAMIDQVVTRTGLSPGHAYVLASLAADLVVSEIVDLPSVVVSLHLSRDVLG